MKPRHMFFLIPQLDHNVVRGAVHYRGVQCIDDVLGPYVVVHGIVRRRIPDITLTGDRKRGSFGPACIESECSSHENRKSVPL
jgi:hypothetical protein